MIKLKNILREAGLVKEQANQRQVLNVIPGDTQQQLQQQLIDSGFDLNNPVTIDLTFDRNLPDNGVPADNQITQLQTTLTAINAIGENVLAVVNASTTVTRATGTSAPTALLTPAGANFANAFPQIANAYSNRTDNTPSNDFLLLNRAGSVYQAAINAGIRNITTTIPTDGTATRRQTKFATLSVTGVFKLKEQEEFTYDLLVRPATATEVNFYRNNNKPSPGALHFNYSNLRLTDLPGTLVGKSSGIVINEKRFREFINKVASGTNFEMRDTNGKLISNEEYVKRMEDGIIGKFKTLSDVIRPIPDLQIFLLENADAIRAKFPNVDIDRGEYVKGVDNIIKLFKN